MGKSNISGNVLGSRQNCKKDKQNNVEQCFETKMFLFFERARCGNLGVAFEGAVLTGL